MESLLSSWSAIRLRAAEKTLLAFFAAIFIASLTLSLPGTTRVVLAILNVMVACLLVALSEDALAARSRIASPIRDWLPALLMLLAYRESGLFIKVDPAHRLDHLFILWDQRILHSPWVEGPLYVCAPWLQHYLELSYLLCYPLVPLGFAALYLTRRVPAVRREPTGIQKSLSLLGAPRSRDGEEPRKAIVSNARSLASFGTTRAAEGLQHPRRTGNYGRSLYAQSFAPSAIFDSFWTTVLLATLFCFAIYPVFPLTPPRVLFSDVPGPPVAPLLRHLNLWVLDRLSVQACVFPSGHAAAVTATALAVRAYRPRLGILFCLAALSVAVATVYGRYHYAADALAGVIVGVVAFVVSRRIHGAK